MIQPGASNTQAVRAVFMIDPEGTVRTILYYPLSTGRNFHEIKRIILALQKADSDNAATPDDDMYCLDWFLCFKKDKSSAVK